MSCTPGQRQTLPEVGCWSSAPSRSPKGPRESARPVRMKFRTGLAPPLGLSEAARLLRKGCESSFFHWDIEGDRDQHEHREVSRKGCADISVSELGTRGAVPRISHHRAGEANGCSTLRRGTVRDLRTGLVPSQLWVQRGAPTFPLHGSLCPSIGAPSGWQVSQWTIGVAASER